MMTPSDSNVFFSDTPYHRVDSPVAFLLIMTCLFVHHTLLPLAELIKLTSVQSSSRPPQAPTRASKEVRATEQHHPSRSQLQPQHHQAQPSHFTPPPQMPLSYVFSPFPGQRLEHPGMHALQNMHGPHPSMHGPPPPPPPPPPPGQGFPAMPFGSSHGWYPPPPPPGGHPYSHPPRHLMNQLGSFDHAGPPHPPSRLQHQPVGAQSSAENVPPGTTGLLKRRPSTPTSSHTGQTVPSKPPPPPPTTTTTTTMTTAAHAAPKAPTPPAQSKPDAVAALAPVPQTTVDFDQQAVLVPKPAKIVPAVPVPALTVKRATSIERRSSQVTVENVLPLPPPPSTGTTPQSHEAASAALQEATQAATAAVAAAMAKLPLAPGKQPAPVHAEVEDLTRKVHHLRTADDGPRGQRQHSGQGQQQQQQQQQHHGASHHRGGGRRGGGWHSQQPPPARMVDLPPTDYDFETANARFNKQDLVKEAIAIGSPPSPPSETMDRRKTNGTTESVPSNGVVEPDGNPPSHPTYNKASSFFDNISSETKDRDEIDRPRPRTREWRGEEQKKNLETFGQGSVDTGHRAHHRGRGRHRGYGYRGRGGQNGHGGHGPRGVRDGGNHTGGNGNGGGGGGGGRGRGGRYRGDQTGPPDPKNNITTTASAGLMANR